MPPPLESLPPTLSHLWHLQARRRHQRQQLQLSSISGSWVPRSGGLRVQLSDRGGRRGAPPQAHLGSSCAPKALPFLCVFEQQIDVLSCPKTHKISGNISKRMPKKSALSRRAGGEKGTREGAGKKAPRGGRGARRRRGGQGHHATDLDAMRVLHREDTRAKSTGTPP